MSPVMNERRCPAVRPPSREACGARPRFRVEWSDGERTDVCQDCALHLREIASEHHVMLKVEPIPAPTESRAA
jgi:hypothetical protein